MAPRARDDFLRVGPLIRAQSIKEMASDTQLDRDEMMKQVAFFRDLKGSKTVRIG